MKREISLSLLWLFMFATSPLRGPLGFDIREENSGNMDYSSFYAYDKSLPLNGEEEIIIDKDLYRVYKAYFDSVNGERVPALLSVPKKKEKVPCIVFLHGYGGSKEDILPAAELIANEGYAIIAIDAEFHGERREEGKELYSTDLKESRRGIIQTIIDLRRAVDYLEMRPEIDKEKIGYVGGSMGGILGGIFIGVEARIKTAALLVAGGNMSLMIRKSKHYTMPAIRKYLEDEQISYEEIQSFLDPVDPINFIDKFSPRPVVFHLGKYDEIVPAEAGEQLYRKAKEPKKVYWYNVGHSLPLDLVLARVLDFMDQELLGRRFVFREVKYWVSKYLPLLLITVGSILLAFIGYKVKRNQRSRK